MRILRPLPDAPTPTRPVLTNVKRRTDWGSIDAEPADLEMPLTKSRKKQETGMKKTGDAGREQALANARKRAMPIIMMYKDGATIPEIAAATGYKDRQVKGIIGRYIKSGKVEVTPSHEDKQIAELYNSGMSHKAMAEQLHMTHGALSSKIHKIRRMGLVGKRVEVSK